MKLSNITLELSSKAYHDESENTMHEVAETMFRQWNNLIVRADQVSVMLWIADGSEILEYTGDLSQRFEWAYWCGCANHCPQRENSTERQKINTHQFPKKYMANAAPRSYAWLKRMIEVLREEAFARTGKMIRIGAIFDNGPEFAISDFKYRRHVEIAQGNSLYPHSFVVCNSRLHADSRAYAGFPDGIPEGTELGEFLGKQYAAFSRDLGYDYIWLSNGMGFGTETWGITGALFDKKAFYPEKADHAAETMLEFWRSFTRNCPGVVIETRGSNFSAGTEIATDAAPLRELYAEFKIAPPVNSPWAALNFNSGLEIAAWMSHVAELPDERFPFRFYTHDPWFVNSPWLDRYAREPWDVYQPLSVSRIDGQGRTQMADRVSILTVDDTFGRMPDAVPNEVTGHILQAFEQGPDAAGPLVWVYPFDEYSEMVRGNGERHPEIVFGEDLYLGEAIQAGIPLNTVVSTGNFRKLLAHGNSTALDGRLWIVPVSAADVVLPHLAGRSVIFYGSLEHAAESLRSLLKIQIGKPIFGNITVSSKMELDSFEENRPVDVAHVFPNYCAGALTECADANDSGVLARAEQNGESRVLAVCRTLDNGGKIGFVRSVFSAAPELWLNFKGLERTSPSQAYPTETLFRQLLAKFGWEFQNRALDADSMLIRTNISRHDNAFFYSLFARDTTVELRTKTPYGAPVLNEMETRLENGFAIWHPGKSWHKECRAFVEQTQRSNISCKVETASYPEFQGRLAYCGMKDATVRFFPPNGFEKTFEAVVASQHFGSSASLLNYTPEKLEWVDSPDGRYVIFHHITGWLYFAW